MEQGVCRHNQTGFCKFKGACQKYHENEMCRDPRCSPKECRKCHPRLCKYFRESGTCKFGEGCSYIHKDDTSKNEINEIKEELNNLNEEIMIIKETVKSLSSVKKEAQMMIQVISDMKEDIMNIKDENLNIVQQIVALEKEISKGSIEDLNSDQEKSFTDSTEKEDMQIKCQECEFQCEREITTNKHTNTKHCEELICKKYEHMLNENDMFKMEIVEGQEVFACNICDEGFDFIVEVNKHIAEAHEDILNHILTRVNDEIERNNHKTEKYEFEFEVKKKLKTPVKLKL